MPAFSIRRLAAGATLAAAGIVGACSDGPSGPALDRAAIVEPAAGTSQTAAVSAAVENAPAVVVRNGSNVPMAGVSVRFEIVRGGGSVDHGLTTTNADGVASSGSWTLGASPGINELRAVVGSLEPVVFTATAYAPAPAPTTSAGAYDVDVRFVGNPTSRQRLAVTRAVARWRSVITGDLPTVPIRAAAGSCFEAQPALDQDVDDLVLFVDFTPIDGAGDVLGEAGPCYVRTSSGLPVVGYLKLDADDLRQMEQYGTIDDVVLHEIGHVLGIGTLWESAGVLTGAGTADPYFTGGSAVAAFRTLGGTAAGVPVENTGSEGTRDGHWRESVFGNELMTGYIGGSPNPLSALTIGSLQDIGYGATYAAASGYALGGRSSRATAPVDLRGREHLRTPRYEVDDAGNVRPWGNEMRSGPRK